MVEVSSIANATGGTNPTSNLLAVQAAITQMSTTLQSLTQGIQTNATPIALSNDNSTLTLATSLGNITLTLATLGIAEKQKLTQQIINLIQTQRPLTLTLQPGSPPSQAVLLVPPQAPQQATGNVTNTTLPQRSVISTILPLTNGDEFTAVVLPSSSATTTQSGTGSTSIPITTNPQNQAASAAANLPPRTAPSVALPTPVTAEPLITEPTLPAAVATSNMATTTQVQSTPLNSVLSDAEALPLTAQTLVATKVTPQFATTMASSQAEAAPIPQTPNVTNPLPSTFASPTPFIQSATVNAAFTATPVTSLSSPPPSLAALLAPGNDVNLKVDLVLQPTQTPPPLATNQILGTVTNSSTNGNLIIKAGNTTLFVKGQVSAPVGTQIILSVGTAKIDPPMPLPILETTNFKFLPQTLAAMVQISPDALMQTMTMHIPQPTDTLPGALMFLLSAFKQGNVRGWLGDDAVETLLHAGREDLVTGLTHELNQGGQPVQDTIVGQWQSYPIPLYSQHQFQALTLYVHSDRDGRQKQSDPDSIQKIRFLIDMRLSKLGAMQVDGFIQKKKLDIVLRSETFLPAGLHNELRTSYIKAVDAVGYAGTLSFQVGREHWMVMQKPSVKGITT